MMTRATLAVSVVLLAACGGDGKTLRDPVFDPPVRVEETVPPTTVPLLMTTVPPSSVVLTEAPADVGQPSDSTSPPPDDREIVFDELFSPANATAEVSGSGALPGDAITVDGEPADVLVFEPSADGTFVARVWIVDEGAHTVCVAATCGRVYTLAPDAESAADVTAKIETALLLAAELLDWETEFPEWTVEIGGQFSGTGGATDGDTKTVLIYRNRGRSIDDFVRTVLHEFGHVADLERLDDGERAEYLGLRQLDPKQPWRSEDSHRIDDWARQPSEDFAEVAVMMWSNGRWLPRTLDPDVVPTQDVLDAVAVMIDSPAG